MMDIANIIATVQEGAQSAQGFFAGISDYLSQLGLEGEELSVGGVALGLAVLWVVARIVRTVVTILFAACILLLVLQLTGYVDLSSLWEMIQGWVDAAAPPAEGAAG